MTAAPKRFPVHSGGMTLPWAMLTPHEPQARENHEQTLQRLAERGGLGWAEILCVLEGKTWHKASTRSDEIAKPLVLQRVAEFELRESAAYARGLAAGSEPWEALMKWETEENTRCVCVVGDKPLTLVASFTTDDGPDDDLFGGLVTAEVEVSGATWTQAATHLCAKLGLKLKGGSDG